MNRLEKSKLGERITRIEVLTALIGDKQLALDMVGQFGGDRWFWEHLAAIDGQTLEKLQKILPVNRSGRVTYLGEEISIKATEIVKQLSVEEVEEFSGFPYRIHNHAYNILCFWKMKEDDDVVRWLGGSEQIKTFIKRWTKASNTPMELLQVMANEELKDVAMSLDSEVFVNFVTQFRLAPLMANPEACKKLLSGVKKGKQAQLMAFLGFTTQIGLTGVSQSKLTEIEIKAFERFVYGKWSQELEAGVSTESTADNLLMISVSGKSHSARREYQASVRAKLSGKELEYRTRINKQSPVLASENLRHWESRLSRERIDLIEDQTHYLSHFYPTLGYEIEFERPRWAEDDSLYDCVDLIGFKKGAIAEVTPEDNLLEFSPGPFNRYQTAAYFFWAYWDSGLIDLHSRYRQSVHLNLGFFNGDGNYSFNRLLMGTGDATIPLGGQDVSGLYPQSYMTIRKAHQLRIKRNVSDVGPYIESKEFCLTTPARFVRFLKSAQILGCGLMAVQKAIVNDPLLNDLRKERMTIESAEANLYSDVADYLWEYDTDKLMAATDSKALTMDEQKIARIYLETIAKFKDGMESLGIEKIVTVIPSIEVAGKFAGEIKKVYPDYWSRYDVNPDKVEGDLVNVFGEIWPNMVAFCGDLTRQAVVAIENVIDSAQADFVVMAGEVMASDDINFEQKLSMLTARYPSLWTVVNDKKQLGEYLRKFDIIINS